MFVVGGVGVGVGELIWAKPIVCHESFKFIVLTRLHYNKNIDRPFIVLKLPTNREQVACSDRLSYLMKIILEITSTWLAVLPQIHFFWLIHQARSGNKCVDPFLFSKWSYSRAKSNQKQDVSAQIHINQGKAWTNPTLFNLKIESSFTSLVQQIYFSSHQPNTQYKFDYLLNWWQEPHKTKYIGCCQVV